MTQSIVLDWVINSTNQTEQHIYRKLDELAEVPLAVVGPLVNTFEDTDAATLAVANVTYRVESVGIYRGVQTKETSSVAKVSLGATIPDSAFTKFVYEQTDTSNTMWMTIGYTAETVSGKVHIDWGDGVKETYAAVDYISDDYDIYIEHEYPANGDYTIKLYSDTPTNYALIGTIKKVIDWGEPSNLQLQLQSAWLVEVPATLHPAMTNLKYLFNGCTTFNQDISGWDVSNVTNMYGMFKKTTIFNQDISGWNVSKVSDMGGMFERANAFNHDLSQWCVALIPEIPYNFALYATLLTQPLQPVWGTCPRGENQVTIPSNEMHFTTTTGTIEYSGVVGDQIVLNDGNTFTLETDSMYDITVPSGKHKLVLVETRSHDYVGLGGVALVEINNFPTLSSVNTFDTCPNTSSPNLVKVPTVLPPNITHIQYMFSAATSFNQDISMWNTSNVTDMTYMFNNAQAFNQPIGNWNVSKITNLEYVFNGATSFNQDISGWDVSNVTDFTSTFEGAHAFNKPLNSWNVSKGTSFNGTFVAAQAFNQPLNNWDVSSATDMWSMFNTAYAFNQDLSQWCVPLIASLPSSFATDATLFTPDKHPVWGTCPRGENQVTIPSNEMHFTTLVGSADYVGTQGDQILLSDGTIVDVTVTDEQVTFDVPVGRHKVKLAESVDRHNFVSVGGEALVELHNFPTLSTVTKFNFSTHEYNNAPNLTKVPEHFPSNIIDIEDLFNTTANFNQDISMWDVSNVKIFNYVFSITGIAFNQPLNSWDVSSATSMRGLFCGATTFNHPLDSWDVSNVTVMSRMFDGATAFNQDLSQWCVGLITSLPSDFATNAPLFTVDKHPVWGTCPVKPEVDEIPSNEMHFTTLAGSIVYIGTQGDQILLSDGTTVDVTVTDQMFEFNVPAGKHKVVLVESIDRSNFVSVSGGALVELHSFPALSTVTKFNFSTINSPNLTKVPEFFPSNITDIENMFGTTENFNQDISMWDVSNVKIFDYAFATTQLFNQPLNTWDVSGATSMRGLFESASSFNQDISGWDTSNVTNMSNMFEFATNFNQPIGSWDVSKVTDMNSMFCMASAFDQPIGEWNVSNVTDMASMFDTTANFNQDISGWDVSNVTSMYSMFDGAATFNSDLSGWNVSNVTSMTNMFRGAIAFNQDLSQWCVPLIGSEPNNFAANVTNWTLPRPVWGTCPRGENIPDSDFTKVTYIKTDTSNTMWLETEYAPENINGELHVDWGDGAKEVLNIADFEADGYYLYLEHEYSVNGEYLVKVYSTTKASYTGFGEITKVIDWGSPSNLQPYFNSDNLIEVPITLHPDLTSLQWLFKGCAIFNQDISMWDTSNVTNMQSMFYGTEAFNQDISVWNVSNVTNMNSMFRDTSAFNQDISGWDVSNVTNMYGMFFGATAFNKPLNNWDVSSATDMDNMFFNATAFNQPLNSWNVSSVTSMRNMFKGTTFNQDLSQWCVPLITSLPSDFATDAPLFTTDKHPVWGTCPRGENVIPDTTSMMFEAGAATVTLYVDIGATVDWGDGTVTTTVQAELTPYWGVDCNKYTHTYNGGWVGKVITMAVDDTSLKIGAFRCEGMKKVKQWYATGYADTLGNNGIFMGLGSVIEEVPTVAPLTNMLAYLFFEATIFNQDISMWDVSQTTRFDCMFQNAAAFNQPLNSWNLGNGVDMRYMFDGCTSFNQPLNNWNVSKCKNLNYLFRGCSVFNQDISAWNVSKVENMSAMFASATAFNQNLSQWCVGEIPFTPAAFSDDVTNWTLPKPVWGTCPRGENLI